MASYEYHPDMLACMVPEHLQDGLKRYIEQGIPTGYGLRTVLTDAPLSRCIPHLDDAALVGLRTVVQFLYNYAPHQCWGSADVVDAWIAAHGLEGLE